MTITALSTIEVGFIHTPTINFAMQQNHVPIVRNITIANNSENNWHNISIEITSEPDFAIAWNKHVDTIEKNTSFDCGIINLRVSTQYLADLTERVVGILTVVVKENDLVLSKETHDVDLLAFDEWGGAVVLPEMLAAFITPNHPEIPRIIKRASEILATWTGSPSFDEYQTLNPDRVKKQMASIFEAITERQIVYCTVPASFEDHGQRVRTADVIFAQQMGNCLDLSLLYAACLEAVGIHPLLVIVKGHAFVGAWLVKDTFTDPVNDDPSLISKRIVDGINEIAVVEATCMSAGQKASFDDAVRSASQHLAKQDDFILFIDVRRARLGGIRPLPLRIKTTSGWEIVDQQVETTRNSASPNAITTDAKIVDVNSIDHSKQKMWERKLLDLSLRNSLLNLRISRSTAQLISVNINQLEDGLASGHEYQLLPKPSDWDNPLRSAGVYQSLNLTDPIFDLVNNELSQKRLRTYLTEGELNSTLVNLYRSSRLSLEENGANTLYMALGLLKWYETNASEQPRYAPLLLAPVEIVRKSVQKGYIIRSREEDTVMNITLLEMLRQDFGIDIGGLESLPRDESGVDVRLVFNTIRQVIMSRPRWDVDEQAFLSIFSFSKFIMWNDIHSNADKLSKNKVVASLISGKLEWQVMNSNDNTQSLDRRYHPSEIALPISTDSSQLVAICAATEGSNFILHGPPGTGKSQTITNIIANALYKGKKVLFVAEKMAALSVVQKRLESIGLGPFCLELHSNKSKKSAVLEQLKRTTELAKKNQPQDFVGEAERLYLLRNELNSYIEALHKVYPFGLSLYDALAGYAQWPSINENVKFDNNTIATLTKEKVTLWTDLAEELQAMGMLCKHPYNHALAALLPPQYTQQLKGEAKEILTIYLNALIVLKSKTEKIKDALQIDVPINQKEHFRTLKTIGELLSSLPDTPSSLIVSENLDATFAQIQLVAQHGRIRDEFRQQLLSSYGQEILSINAESNLAEWNEAANKWILPRWLKQRQIIKLLKGISLSGSVDAGTVPETLGRIISYKKEQAVVDQNAGYLLPILGILWQAGNCDWKKVEAICDIFSKINNEVIGLLKNVNKAKEWRINIAKELSDGTKGFITANGKGLEEYVTAYGAVNENEAKISQKLGVDFEKINENIADRIDHSILLAQQWLNNIEQLRDWFGYTQIRSKAMDIGLLPLVAAYESGIINSVDVLASFKKGLNKSCAEYIFDSEPDLSSFNGKLFEEKIRRFREISNNFEQLTKDELVAKLSSKIPSFTQEASQSSEIGILQKAIRNGGRGLALRKLFDTIPNLLSRMTPCMLMSPISVAQYFEAGDAKFDLVVFDEASQIPTCEAIGAIARGTNVVVVGDPNQMPPTSFFSTNKIDEDNAQEDMESILDDCLALSMPSNHLLWHYRSKHESLIAFSNSKYYGNKLLTFPSPDDITSKVTYVNVNGYYDRSKTRQNKAEAQAIVKEIVTRLSDKDLSQRSIGVVTFSSAQQTLIDDLLNEEFKKRPDLEAQVMAAAEPIFIKNLENVQGDERDVILFSIGYGPDADGKVSLHFGPINREGGWRRLNVAVSRARYEMKVFATLKADQIDETRSASEGVAGLKAFLQYAEKGKIALQQNSANIIKTDALVQSIANSIEPYGYKVHTNIGCSGYRIDIGVVNPTKPSEYIMGVLCDGNKAAKTAKDREIIQTEVLKLLGWNIHKVWSPEWLENPTKVTDDILAAIKLAETKTHEPVSPIVVAPKVTQTLEHLTTSQEEVETINTNTTNPAVIGYRMCFVEPINTMSADDFLNPVNKQKICEQIMQVVDAEAPISKDLLSKRVLSAWGLSRGSRISKVFDILLNSLTIKTTGQAKDMFIWKAEQDPLDYTQYRLHTDETHKRNAEELAPEEVANAIREILQNQISLPKNDLVKETARMFGYARLGSNVELSMLKGVQIAVTKGYATEENERIIFAS